MRDLPASVHIREVGPREGIQIERQPIETAAKARIVDALAETGLQEIEFISFVNPERVPSMADAEQVAATIRPKPGVKYEGIWLNLQGLDRALALRDKPLHLRPTCGIPASSTFAQKNTNRSTEQAIDELPKWAARYKELGFEDVELLISAAFGCNYEGDVPPARVFSLVETGIQKAAEAGVPVREIELLDTMGWGNPLRIKQVVGGIQDRWPDTPISLHLHDTRGTGLANFMAALEMGVASFDAAVGGWGGCPFAEHKGAAGNISTEDTVFLCQELGVSTGIDLNALIEVARLVESTIGRGLPGKVKTGGNLANYRARAAVAA